MFTFAVVGFGARGRKYSALLQKKGARLVAVCDKDKTILEYAGRTFGLEKTALYSDYESFFDT